MKAKICFSNEIHKISKLPRTFEELTKLIPTIFHIELPQSWTLQYVDSDGDNILLTDEKDYEELVSPLPGHENTSAIVKIHIISTDVFRTSQVKPQEEVSQEVVENKAEDDYQVILNEEDKKEEVIKTEEVPIEKEEEVQGEKESKAIDNTTMEETMEKSEVPIQTEVLEVLNSVKDQLEESIIDNSIKVQVEEPVEGSIIDNSSKVQVEEPVEESKEVMSESVVKAENKVMVDLDTLEKLVSGMMEKSLTKIVETTKELVAKDESKIVLPDEKPVKVPENKVIHYGVGCNGCNMTPIVGIRYKCTVCSNFDYCEACEEKYPHIHDFVKMRQRDLLDVFKPQPVEKPQRRHRKPEVRFAVSEEEEARKEARRAEQKKLNDLEEKAEKLWKCFPKEDICALLVYINEAPEDMTFEELVENFKH